MKHRKLRFIPYRKRDILTMCLRDGRLNQQEEQLLKMYERLTSIFILNSIHILRP